MEIMVKKCTQLNSVEGLAVEWETQRLLWKPRAWGGHSLLRVDGVPEGVRDGATGKVTRWPLVGSQKDRCYRGAGSQPLVSIVF